ncbi:Putative zn(2)Cys(6) fungal-type DNA-binding domain-containing protein [Colletotrichum destructivum]|uniref:Zn(2)Cys(6) fungal-type DNA-binding domain-containing protein n=1 Tax=Colletotrichum destructivum TaxID=34406 RepID=A0AAX4I6G8_9PEZI|nr:Putative zn(2)Cys(6) fungal-type DNA-binding domain-containing protein [Colletotrichum destructivum]
MAPEGQGPRNTTETETEADAASSAARGRRANNACTRCRERKVKCSGSFPCANCLRKSVECVFDKEDRKVVVSERFLNDLKRKSGYGLDREHAAPTPKRTRYRPSASPGDHCDHDGTVDAHESSTAAPVDGEHQGTVDDGGTTVVGGEVDNEEPRGLLSTMRNPLASGPSKFVTDASGRRREFSTARRRAISGCILTVTCVC